MSYIAPSGLLVECEFGDAYVAQNGILLTGDFVYAGATAQTFDPTGDSFAAFGTAAMLRGFSATGWDSLAFGTALIARDSRIIDFGYTSLDYSGFGTAFVDFAIRTLDCTGRDFAMVWTGYTPRTDTEPASGVRHAARVLDLDGMADHAVFGTASFELQNRTVTMNGVDAAEFGVVMLASQPQFAGGDHAAFGAPEIGHLVPGTLWVAGTDFAAMGVAAVQSQFLASGSDFAAVGAPRVTSVLSVAAGADYSDFGEHIVLHEYACNVWRIANMTTGDMAGFGTATVTT